MRLGKKRETCQKDTAYSVLHGRSKTRNDSPDEILPAEQVEISVKESLNMLIREGEPYYPRDRPINLRTLELKLN